MSDAITAPRQPVLPESFDPIIAEMLGRGNGLLGGKGGSMHHTSTEHGMMGSYAMDDGTG
jgi:TPP-dependent pyruvate/acetoin dehydrogenase alpha subunit